MTSIVTKIFWGFFIVVLLLLVAELLTDLEITKRSVNKALIFILILGLAKIVTRKAWTRTLIISMAWFAMFLAISHFLDWRGDWKTQTIIYQNKHLANRTIEFQLQDKGSFGYNRRTVDRLRLLPFISWTKKLNEEDFETLDLLTWEKVDIDINEQELKGG